MTGEPDWEDVLRAAAALQDLIPAAVVGGGTAAAVHAGHRRSFAADHVLVDRKERFDELIAFLEQRSDWGTARVRPPVLILGSFHGVETGLRQQEWDAVRAAAATLAGEIGDLLAAPDLEP